MKRKPYFDEICEHACTELDYRTMVCATTKKRELAGAEYELFVDVTTFDNYDEMVEFCQRYFQDEDVLFPYGHNFPDEYIEDGLRFQDIKQFGSLNKEQKNAIELYLWLFGVRGVQEILDVYIGTFKTKEEAAKYIVKNNLCELPDNIKDCKDYGQVYECLRDRILVAENCYFFADK